MFEISEMPEMIELTDADLDTVAAAGDVNFAEQTANAGLVALNLQLALFSGIG
jgi:hypothetical protein